MWLFLLMNSIGMKKRKNAILHMNKEALVEAIRYVDLVIRNMLGTKKDGCT